jgi:hypothetical protein
MIKIRMFYTEFRPFLKEKKKIQHFFIIKSQGYVNNGNLVDVKEI